MRREKNRINPEDIVRLVTRCEDAVTDAQLERRLRELKRRVSQIPAKQLTELPEVLETLKNAIVRNEGRMIEIHLARAEELTASGTTSGTGERKKRMSLFARIKDKIVNREANAQNKLMNQQEKAAADNVYALTQKVEELMGERSKVAGELEKKVAQCRDLPKGGAEYTRISQEAKLLIPRVKMLDKQINMHIKVLQDNAQYQNLIATGKLTIDLKQYVLDVNRTEAMLGMITDQVETVSEDITAFGESVGEFSDKLGKAMDVDMSGLDDEFESMLAHSAEAEKPKEAPIAASAVSAVPQVVDPVDDEFERMVAQKADPEN